MQIWKSANTFGIIWNYHVEDFKLTLYFAMSQNGQANLENLAAFAAIFLRCVWPIYDIAK